MPAPKKFILKTLIQLCLCLVSLPAHSLTTTEFETEYQTVLSRYQEIVQRTESHQQKASRRQRPRYLANRPQASKEFKKIQKQKRYLDKIQGLSQDLAANYLKTSHKKVDGKKLRQESLNLAIGVVDEIGRLKSKYKSFAIPIVHNMLIDVGLKKRGACKHWAEDLLTFLRTTKRDFFYVTWGEANPKKMTEHNVAVIYPNHASFYDGLLIDPWRTSGKPFWIPVKKDKHYKWNPWDYYGVY